MGGFFPHPVKIINVKMVKGAMNPWELHDFLYPHFFIPYPMTCVVAYSLSGDIPKGISVDAAGNIKGKIKHFGKQPSCQSNYPNEPRKLDGSNWENDGRFNDVLFDFNFSIKCDWVEHISTTSGPVPCVKAGNTSQDCIIRLIKDHNIDHKIYRDKYMAGGSEVVNDIDIPFVQGDEANPGPLQSI